jgi:hypothetical protein
MKSVMTTFLHLSAITLSCWYSGSCAAEDVKVSLPEIYGLIQADAPGPYQKILAEASKRSGYAISENVYPIKRAIMTFMSGRSLAVVGLASEILRNVDSKNIVATYPLSVYKAFIFTRKGEPAISSMSQLNGKVVGITLGYEFNSVQWDKYQINLQHFSNEKYQFNRLYAGRVDAIVGFLPDWIPFLESLSYDPEFPIEVGYDYIIVWNNPKGRRFAEKISYALLHMKEDGTLKEIMGDRYMEFDYRPSEPYEWKPLLTQE